MSASDAPLPPDAATPAARPATVPEELLNKLHEANEQFSKARHHREEAIDSLAFDEGAEREAAGQELRDAEKRLEEVTEEIDHDLHDSR